MVNDKMVNDMRKQYILPRIEVVCLASGTVMQALTGSNHEGSQSGNRAPKRDLF